MSGQALLSMMTRDSHPPRVLSVGTNPTLLAVIVLMVVHAVTLTHAQPLIAEVPQQTDRERIKADRAKMDDAMKRETTKRPWDGLNLLRAPAVDAPVASSSRDPK